jgi:hypothetical protein
MLGAEVLCRRYPRLQLAAALHEEDLRRRGPVAVRVGGGAEVGVLEDAWLDFRIDRREQVAIALEVDRGTTPAPVWKRKVEALLAWSKLYPDVYGTTSLTIAVVATSGERRASQLRGWTEAELSRLSADAEADLWRFTGKMNGERVPEPKFFFDPCEVPFLPAAPLLSRIERVVGSPPVQVGAADLPT